MTMLSFHDVAFAYPDQTPVFAQVSLAVEEGDFVLVQGPSGAGKSTLLRLMNRLEEPVQGEVRYQGEPLAALAPTRLRREVSYLQQTPVVLDLSVRANLLLPFSFAVNADRAAPDDKVLREQLDAFLLPGVELAANALTLSVGQRQRLCLIRALLPGPAVLLMDEPASALDPDSRRVVEDAAETAHAQGVTVVMISHHDYAPRTLVPRILRVQSGAAVMEDNA